MSKISTDIADAARLLRAGGLVALPTETVYGLAADAMNPEAVRKVFAAKGRPADHPLIVHLADTSQLTKYAREIPAVAHALLAAFSPGPLTLIFKKTAQISDLVTGGQDTVAIRIPAHPVAHALLQAFGGGLVAPSANRFGRISPTDAQHVAEELGDKVDLILSGGRSAIGIESTIIDVSEGTPRMLRAGILTQAEIEDVLGYPISLQLQAKPGHLPRVSGSLLSHYAPRTPLELCPVDTLSARIETLLKQGQRLALIHHHPFKVPTGIKVWTLPNDVAGYAHHIYAAMREADALNLDKIIVAAVPSEWLAVADRLQRAAFQAPE